MKQIKFLGVVALALSLGLAACNGGGTKSSSKHTHNWGEYTTVTAATCTEKGSEKRTCSGCDQVQTRDIPALGHQFLEGDADVKTDVVEATCEGAGSYKHVCQRCQQTIQETVPAKGHDWELAADQSAATPATCTEDGTEIYVCKNDPTHTKTEPVEALGHDFPENGTKLPVPAATETNTKGEVPFHWAEITNYSCTRGDSYRYAWSAKEVNFDYTNEGVHWTQEEIDAAQEGDAAYGKTTADWKSEPNLLDEGDGIRFWGRPIGNAMVLSNQGRASSNDDVKVPDETVKGSRFEFDFVFDKDVNDVCLSAELTPAEYTNDIFKNRSQDQEWTPGYRFVDDDNNPSTPKVPEQIQGMRFIILLDGVEVDLDETVNTAPAGRKWYQFPCKLNLTAGKHNLNIAMAGGYLHTFYQFSFEKVPPKHEHNFAGEKVETLSGEGLTSVDVFNCPKGDARALRWDAKSYDTTLSNEIEAAATDGSIRFNRAQGKNGEDDKGGHLVYKVKSPAAVTDASLAFYIQAHNQNVDVFDVVANDSGAGKDVDPTTGKYTVTPTRRYALYVNDVRVELGNNEYGKTTAKDWFTFPATFNLNQGENKIEIVSLGGYRAKMYNFQLVCPIAQ